MAIRDKYRANAQHLLQPGEEVQAVFGAQTRSGWIAAVSTILVFLIKYRAVVVTDRRIVVAESSRWKPTAVDTVVAELPRNTLIGPAHGIWYETAALGPQPLYVHKRFHADIAAADALVDPTAA
jgi:hypothetical protein